MQHPNYATGQAQAPFLDGLARYVLHRLLVCVCQEGHLRGKCFYGRFDMSSILVSPCGHVRFSDDVQARDYESDGSDADYQQLFFIVSTFVDFTTRRFPVHVISLLKVLRNAPESLRTKEEFVAFLVNHPCLLTFAERQMLYNLVDSLLYKLLKNPAVQDQGNTLKSWVSTQVIQDWQQTAQNVVVLRRTYMHGARRPASAPINSPLVSIYKPGVDQCVRLSRNYLGHTYIWVSFFGTKAFSFPKNVMYLY